MMLNNDLKEYWTKNPDKFIEDFYGIKLLPIQRNILKALSEKKSCYVTFPRYSGYSEYKRLMWLLHKILYGDNKS